MGQHLGTSQGLVVQMGKLRLRACQAMNVRWSWESNPGLASPTATALASQHMATGGPPGADLGRGKSEGPHWASVSPWVSEGPTDKGPLRGLFQLEHS